jgi:tetratricopeptide (TPR) repeat protein
VDALDRHLRGREIYHRTEAGHLQKSQEMFEEAIRIDPNYALAWAGLTHIYVDTYWYRDKDDRWIERAHEASSKAVSLAPHLAESHGARGLALWVDEQFDAAEAEFEKSIAINPRLFEPLHFYAQMMRGRSQLERAADLFCRAAEVRPEDYQALAVASNMFEATGDEERRLWSAREGLERATRALELNPGNSRARILAAGLLLSLGEREKSLEWASQVYDNMAPGSTGILYNLACIYARIGETERALDFLEQGVDAGARNKGNYENDPDFDSIREHPRFKALLERI